MASLRFASKISHAVHFFSILSFSQENAELLYLPLYENKRWVQLMASNEKKRQCFTFDFFPTQDHELFFDRFKIQIGKSIEPV
jgi:hypothetical protein